MAELLPAAARSSRRSWTACAWIAAAVALAAPMGAAAVDSETPANIIAAHVRQQGYDCSEATGATRDHQASRPDEPVWTLSCSNATYRVRLIADMAATVEKIEPAAKR